METLLETIQMEDLYIRNFPLKDSLIVPLESCVICAITQDLLIDGDAQLSPSSFVHNDKTTSRPVIRRHLDQQRGKILQ